MIIKLLFSSVSSKTRNTCRESLVKVWPVNSAVAWYMRTGVADRRSESDRLLINPRCSTVCFSRCLVYALEVEGKPWIFLFKL